MNTGSALVLVKLLHNHVFCSFDEHESHCAVPCENITTFYFCTRRRTTTSVFDEPLKAVC